MVKRLFFRHANSLIAVLLVALGIAAMQWPAIIGDKGAAATLAGALFGAAALFAGAEINDWSRQLTEKEQLEEMRRRLRSALAPEFIRVCINIIGFSEGLSTYKNFTVELSKKAGKHGHRESERPGDFDWTGIIPPPAPWFEKLHADALCLPEEELGALSTFYGDLESTRVTIREMATMLEKTPQDSFQLANSAQFIVDKMRGNLEEALRVAKLSWPNHKMDSFHTQKQILVSEELQLAIEKLERTKQDNID